MISKAKPERAASPMNGHGRACPGHPAYRGTAVPHDRGRRDKPGDDGVNVSTPANFTTSPSNSCGRTR